MTMGSGETNSDAVPKRCNKTEEDIFPGKSSHEARILTCVGLSHSAKFHEGFRCMNVLFTAEFLENPRLYLLQIMELQLQDNLGLGAGSGALLSQRLR